MGRNKVFIRRKRGGRGEIKMESMVEDGSDLGKVDSLYLYQSAVDLLCG